METTKVIDKDNIDVIKTERKTRAELLKLKAAKVQRRESSVEVYIIPLDAEIQKIANYLTQMDNF